MVMDRNVCSQASYFHYTMKGQRKKDAVPLPLDGGSYLVHEVNTCESVIGVKADRDKIVMGISVWLGG